VAGSCVRSCETFLNHQSYYSLLKKDASLCISRSTTTDCFNITKVIAKTASILDIIVNFPIVPPDFAKFLIKYEQNRYERDYARKP
jgi:hypothetical protein